MDDENEKQDATDSGTGEHGTLAQRMTLTVGEAAEQLGISRAYTYELIRQGVVPALRLGRRIVVPRQRLEELVALGGQPSPEGPRSRAVRHA